MDNKTKKGFTQVKADVSDTVLIPILERRSQEVPPPQRRIFRKKKISKESARGAKKIINVCDPHA